MEDQDETGFEGLETSDLIPQVLPPAPGEARGPEVTRRYRRYGRILARSFYRKLRDEGFAHDEIIELACYILDCVNEEFAGGGDPTSEER